MMYVTHIIYTILIKIITKDARILFSPKKLRFRTFIYFYHDVMRLTKGDTSFPRAWISRFMDFTRGEQRKQLISVCVTLAEIGCDCSNIRVLQEKLAH